MNCTVLCLTSCTILWSMPDYFQIMCSSNTPIHIYMCTHIHLDLVLVYAGHLVSDTILQRARSCSLQLLPPLCFALNMWEEAVDGSALPKQSLGHIQQVVCCKQ